MCTWISIPACDLAAVGRIIELRTDEHCGSLRYLLLLVCKTSIHCPLSGKPCDRHVHAIPYSIPSSRVARGSEHSICRRGVSPPTVVTVLRQKGSCGHPFSSRPNRPVLSHCYPFWNDADEEREKKTEQKDQITYCNVNFGIWSTFGRRGTGTDSQGRGCRQSTATSANIIFAADRRTVCGSLHFLSPISSRPDVPVH